MDIPFFDAQSELLFRIAQLRDENLDLFFRFVNYFDSPYFLMVIIPFVWVAISHRWGLRLAILLIVNSLINFHLKQAFDLPRPLVAFPTLPMYPVDDPGFPSGAAQMGVLLGGFLIYSWKSVWSWVIGIPFSLLMGFSRLYLGLHYPMDIFGGYLFGLALLFAYIYSIDAIESFCEKQGRGFCIILSIVLSFLYAFFLPSPQSYRLISAFLGFTLGAYSALRFRLYPTRSRSFKTVFLSGLIAVIGIFLLNFLMPSPVPAPIRSFILALWASCIASPVCRIIIRRS